jgi:hypothetical protein
MKTRKQIVSTAGFERDASAAEYLAVSELRAREWEVKLYHRIILLRCAATFVAMLLCYAGCLPVWALILANIVLYPEIYLRIHDIGHSTSVGSYGWAARFVPVTNPIWGGTRVFAMVHKEHHKYLGTDRDPWLPYYTGHPLLAFFYNLIEPEYSLRQFIRLYGPDREVVRNILYNVVALVAGVALFQWAYLAHLGSQRIVHCIGIFFFNFYTHRERLSASAPIGTWERESDLRSALPFLCLVWGRDTVDGLIYHNRHHCVGQQHVPVHHYRRLTDSGNYTAFQQDWPIATIKEL